MRFGLDVAQHHLQWNDVLERTRFAEEAGFDSAWVFDHFHPLYANPIGPCLEAWALLAGLAAHTERIRLGALVTGVTYRHPSILATEAVTVDHISNGRLNIGIGAAWHEPEHRALGIAFPPVRERAERLEEAIVVMRALMTQSGVTFKGRHYQLDDATYEPRPVQRPHPPFWIGASGERLTLPIVGRHADVWHTWVRDFERKWEVVRHSAEQAGRDPDSIQRSVGLSLSQPWDRVRAAVEQAAAWGVTELTVGWPSEGRAHLDTFVERYLPELQDL